ncbi:hypothetical protein BDR07DRAFT_1495708 [Suillus spraguei]|nr:hypothetical protein BDR07DRAFT_1495708 [Suillus spraguei]
MILLPINHAPHFILVDTSFLAFSITGLPVDVRNSLIILPLTRRLNFSNGTINLVRRPSIRMADVLKAIRPLGQIHRSAWRWHDLLPARSHGLAPALRDLKFHIGDDQILIPNAQIWPRALNRKIPGGENEGIYLIITNLGTATGPVVL